MVKLIVVGVASFLVGALITVLLMYKMAPSMMMKEDVSKYNMEETLRIFEESVEKHNWKIPHVHDLQATMKKYGKDVRPVYVYELCHPDHAVQILEKDDERIVSSLMPCRISFYEKSDGKVYVSRMNSGLMAKTFGGVIADVMKDAAAENEVILKAIL